MKNQNQSVDIQATTKLLEEINRKWESLKGLAEQQVSAKIEFANTGREIGLSLQILCKHTQMHLSFFEGIKDQLPATLCYASAQKCIKLANAYPEPIVTLQEAGEAEQWLLIATGEDEEPMRLVDRVANSSTPSTFIWNALSTVEDRIEKRIVSIEQWDNETRKIVKEQICKHRDWLDEVESKL